MGTIINPFDLTTLTELACFHDRKSVQFASAGANGLFYVNPRLFLIQLVTVLVVTVFAFGVTYGLAMLLKKTAGLRVSEVEEEVGLDISEHGEQAYA